MEENYSDQPYAYTHIGRFLKGLTGNEVEVYLALASCQGKADKCWPKREEIGRRAGLPVSQWEHVGEITASLEKKGRIKKIQRWKRVSNVYVCLHIPRKVTTAKHGSHAESDCQKMREGDCQKMREPSSTVQLKEQMKERKPLSPTALEAIQAEYGRLRNGKDPNKLQRWLDSYPPEWIQAAMSKALQSPGKGAVAYAEGILKDYARTGGIDGNSDTSKGYEPEPLKIMGREPADTAS